MERLLHHAYNLASQGLGSCAPNPAVGAVVVQNGKIVGEGWHRGPGRAHAEVEALNLAGDRAQGGLLVVSLEPCNHTGRTGPCTEAIRRSGISRVLYGFADPNSDVTGGGAEQLQSWGVEVKRLETAEGRRFYRDYAHWLRSGEPRWVAKMAVSSDGKVAAADGPVKLSGPQADGFTHEQRQQADAILTTAATVRADDPQMNSRRGATLLPRDVWVLARQGNLPEEAKLWSTAKSLHLVVGEQMETDPRWTAKGATVHRVSEGPTGLDLAMVKKTMGQAGYHRVWIESGPRLFEALTEAQLLDQAFVYHCPVVVGSDGVEAFRSDQWVEGASMSWEALGPDGCLSLEYPCSQD